MNEISAGKCHVGEFDSKECDENRIVNRSFLFLFLSLGQTDLTSRPGFWGKALPERYVDVGVLFAFHFTAGGDMMLTVDGHEKGVFLTGIDSRTPLWVMIDIYGNTTAVQFVGKSST